MRNVVSPPGATSCKHSQLARLQTNRKPTESFYNSFFESWLMGVLELPFKPFSSFPLGSPIEPFEDLLDTLLPLGCALRLTCLALPVPVKRFNGPDEIHEAMFWVRQRIVQ